MRPRREGWEGRDESFICEVRLWYGVGAEESPAVKDIAVPGVGEGRRGCWGKATVPRCGVWGKFSPASGSGRVTAVGGVKTSGLLCSCC